MAFGSWILHPSLKFRSFCQRRGHQCVLQIEIHLISCPSLLMQMCVVGGWKRQELIWGCWWGLFLEYSELRMGCDNDLCCVWKQMRVEGHIPNIHENSVKILSSDAHIQRGHKKCEGPKISIHKVSPPFFLLSCLSVRWLWHSCGGTR
jgi:hypothetical protein